jgi:GT2 family glycosyltransferase/glycosyltransferase involved in cell wall biosynthesis
LAKAAHERALSLTAAGDHVEASRWTERAYRLLPSDDTLALAWASACLGRDDARAVELFAMLAARHDGREVWAGLAIARRNTGDVAGAAEAVSYALARLVPDTTLGSVAAALAPQLGAPGWCGASFDGVLTIHATDETRHIELEIDGKQRRSVRAGRIHLPEAWWRAGHVVSVTAAGMHLLGSPIDARAIRRVEGWVTGRDGAIEGWAWHPADLTIDPMIRVSAASGPDRTVVARDESGAAAGFTLLGRPRRFRLCPDRLSRMVGPFHVRGSDGLDLLGSPLDPTREQRAAVAAARAVRAALETSPRRIGRMVDVGTSALAAAVPADIVGPSPPVGCDRRQRFPDVVIPVHGGGAIALACITAVLATVSSPSRVVVVDDATPDPDLVEELAELARRRRIKLVRHARNRGYTASANAGIRACGRRDVVLVNSDTIVAPSWLDRLREIAYSAPDIGTVSPLSNNATLLSYPQRDEYNPMPEPAATARLAVLAYRTNRGVAVDIPVGVGFCMYLRRDCLDAVGAFREDVFAQGYGEENDFCLRARHLGWRHVAAPGVFVGHRGAQSFGAAGEALRTRNQTVLERLHPGHASLIARHLRADPLAQARRRLDMARWRAMRPMRRTTALLISHNDGGGVEQCVAAACAAHRAAGTWPIVMRPARLADGTPGAVLADGVANGFPNLRFALPSELPGLARFLLGTGLREVELHHLLGHHPAVLRLISVLGVPYDVHAHDYALICPRVALVGRDRRYCGEPAVATCEACIADLGSISGEQIGVAALRHRSGLLLAAARQVVAPSEDTAARLRRHFPGISVRVVPLDNDQPLAVVPHATQPRRGGARICVIGAIGVEKGYEILLACARDAADRELPLEFVVVGHTIDDARLMECGRVFVTGEFEPAEAVRLIASQGATLAWLPSVWPETWCFTLSEAWRAGLRVVAFDLGAPAERIRRCGGGVLLPLGLPPPAINAALLEAARLAGQP